MKVEVDQLKCRTVGMCVKICPEIFRFQEGSKRATTVVNIIPLSHQQKCREAARKCPNKAITISD